METRPDITGPTQPPAIAYSRAEKLSDATIHVIGVTSALVAVGVLITLVAAWRAEPSVLVGTVVYSVCLLLMLACSAAYHMTPWEEWKDLLRRLDQSAIYVKIAGTYTPFAVLAGSGAGFLAGIWGAALAGLALKLLVPGRFISLGLALYLGMGWCGVVLGGDMIAGLSGTGFALMLAGGVIYTLGVIFFLWEALPFHNTIWHAHVLVATGIFYAAVVVEIAEKSLV